MIVYYACTREIPPLRNPNFNKYSYLLFSSSWELAWSFSEPCQLVQQHIHIYCSHHHENRHGVSPNWGSNDSCQLVQQHIHMTYWNCSHHHENWHGVSPNWGSNDSCQLVQQHIHIYCSHHHENWHGVSPNWGSNDSCHCVSWFNNIAFFRAALAGDSGVRIE